LTGPEIVLSIVVGLAINEATDVCPWLAQRLVRIAARVWTPDSELSAVYAEEWSAFIVDRPGKIFKLLTALGFLGNAVLRRGSRAVTRREWQFGGALRFPLNAKAVSHVLAIVGLAMVFSPLGLALIDTVIETSVFILLILPMAGILVVGFGAILNIRAAGLPLNSRAVVALSTNIPDANAPSSEIGPEREVLRGLFVGFHHDGLKSFEYTQPIGALIRPYTSSPTPTPESPDQGLLDPFESVLRDGFEYGLFDQAEVSGALVRPYVKQEFRNVPMP